MDDTLLYSLRALQQSFLLQHKLLLQAVDTLLPSSGQQPPTETTALIVNGFAAAVVSNDAVASGIPAAFLAPDSGTRTSHLNATVTQLQQQIYDVGEELHALQASNARMEQTLAALHDMRRSSNGKCFSTASSSDHRQPSIRSQKIEEL